MRTISVQASHRIQEWKTLLSLLKDLITDTYLIFKQDGIFIEQVDPERVTITQVKLLNLSFYKFSSNEDIYIGVSIQYLYKLVKSCSDIMTFTLRIYEDDPENMEVYVIHPENRAFSISVAIPSMILPRTKFHVPDIDYKFVLEVPIKRLQKAVRDAAHTSKHVILQALGSDGYLSVKAQGPNGKLCFTITEEEFGFFWYNRPGPNEMYEESFFHKYLERFLKTELDSKVLLHMQQGCPLQLQVSIPFVGNVTHYIAGME